MNIIGDIAGQYKTFLALIEKMPDAEVLSLGDMIDRGPQSKEVLEWFMKNGKAILGNHEHMMVDYCNQAGFYDSGIWKSNGGWTTLQSYKNVIPEDTLEWIANLPVFYKADGLVATHAPINPMLGLDRAKDLGTGFLKGYSTDAYKSEMSVIWNRGDIRRIETEFQVYGHQGLKNPHWHKDKQGDYGVCIDTCKSKVLTGMHWPSRKLYTQEYLD